jgi:hypothetical protein
MLSNEKGAGDSLLHPFQAVALIAAECSRMFPFHQRNSFTLDQGFFPCRNVNPGTLALLS